MIAHGQHAGRSAEVVQAIESKGGRGQFVGAARSPNGTTSRDDRVIDQPELNTGARYVALGSSFAAGPGPGWRAPGSPRRAGRSSANYAHLIAAHLGLELTDVTYSGATTRDILNARADGWPARLRR